MRSEKCLYTISKKKAPYPRVSYDCECGFFYVQCEGYLYDVDGGRTNRLNLPSGNCMCCKKEIDTKNEQKIELPEGE